MGAPLESEADFYGAICVKRAPNCNTEPRDGPIGDRQNAPEPSFDNVARKFQIPGGDIRS